MLYFIYTRVLPEHILFMFIILIKKNIIIRYDVMTSWLEDR